MSRNKSLFKRVYGANVWLKAIIPAPRTVRKKACCEFMTILGYRVRKHIVALIDLTQRSLDIFTEMVLIHAEGPVRQ